MSNNKFHPTRRYFLKSAGVLTAGSVLPSSVGGELFAVLQTSSSRAPVASQALTFTDLFNQAWDAFSNHNVFSADADLAKLTGDVLENTVRTHLENTLPPLLQAVGTFYKLRQKFLTGDQEKDHTGIQMLGEIINAKKQFVINELRRLAEAYPKDDPRLQKTLEFPDLVSGSFDEEELDKQFEVDIFKSLMADFDLMPLPKDGYKDIDVRNLGHLRDELQDFWERASRRGILSDDFKKQSNLNFLDHEAEIRRLAAQTGHSLNLINMLTDAYPSFLDSVDYINDFTPYPDHELIDVLFDDEKLFNRMARIVSDQVTSVAWGFMHTGNTQHEMDNLSFARQVLPNIVEKIYLDAFRVTFPHIHPSAIPLPGTDTDTVQTLLQMENRLQGSALHIDGEVHASDAVAERLAMDAMRQVALSADDTKAEPSPTLATEPRPQLEQSSSPKP